MAEGKGSEFLDALDHPIMFTFLIAIVVAAWLSLLTWGAKAAGIPGAAAFFQHP